MRQRGARDCQVGFPFVVFKKVWICKVEYSYRKMRYYRIIIGCQTIGKEDVLPLIAELRKVKRRLLINWLLFNLLN